MLMISDHHFNYWKKVRSVFSVVVFPVQESVNLPIKSVNWITSRDKTRHELFEENEKLKRDILLLEVKTHKIIALKKENAQLRALLSSSAKLNDRVLVAQLLAINSNIFDPQVVLDKGSKHGIYVGQPVLDADGIMGQVISVGPYTSRVLLITSTRSAIPVLDNRSNIRAIAVGAGDSGRLNLIHVPDTSDIKAGDQLVASGLGLRFPIGYPVGIVQSVQHIAGDRFATIDVRPSAKLNSSRQVLLVWSSRSKLSRAVKKMLGSYTSNG